LKNVANSHEYLFRDLSKLPAELTRKRTPEVSVASVQRCTGNSHANSIMVHVKSAQQKLPKQPLILSGMSKKNSKKDSGPAETDHSSVDAAEKAAAMASLSTTLAEFVLPRTFSLQLEGSDLLVKTGVARPVTADGVSKFVNSVRHRMKPVRCALIDRE
jgi:hypothetical protein